MADDALGLNPDRVNKFLQDELNGTAPPEVIDYVNRKRKESPGSFPPPIFPASAPRVNTSGKVQKPVTNLAAPPNPEDLDVGSGRKLGFMPTMPEAVDAAKSTAKSLLDPETVGAIGGSYAGGLVGQPVLGAGAGAAAGNIAKQVYDRTANPQPGIPDLWPAAGAFIAGAAGEGLSRGFAGNIRREVTPQGAEVQKFFGRPNTMVQQMTDSPALDFAANVARYGPGGKKIMTEAESKQSQAVLDNLQGISHDYGKTVSINPSSGEFDTGEAGKRIQSDVQTQLKNARATSGYPEFSNKYGQSRQIIPEVDPVTGEPLTNRETGEPIVRKGPTVDRLQAKRSDTLAKSRQAYAAGDVKAQSDYLNAADKLHGRINKALPDDAARQEYRAIADKYSAEMGRLDNPTVQDVRTGKSNDVIDDILNNKLKNYAPMKTGVGQTNQELLGRMQSALSPDAWSQLQADTVHRMGEMSVDPKTGMVDVKDMRKVWDNLDLGTKKTLFGKNIDKVNKVLNVVEQANKYKESEAGRLFIAIRTGQAGIKLAGAAVGAVGAAATLGSYAGGKEGHPVIGGVAGAATVMLSPYAFAKLLTSEVGRTLLTRAASKGLTDSAAQQVKRGIARFVAQNATQGINEAVAGELNTTSDNSIPEPPK